MSTKKYAVEFSKTVWRIIEVEIEIEEEDRPFVNESLAEDKAIQVLMDEGAFRDGWEADSVWEVEAPVKDSPHTLTPQVVDLLYRQSQYLKQEDRDAINLRLATLHITNEDLLKED
jgi:hypothetical protein